MYIKVRAKPDAKNESLQQKSPDHFEISVREPAEQNRANIRIREILARYFGLSLTKVRLISGHHSPSKIFSIDSD